MLQRSVGHCLHFYSGHVHYAASLEIVALSHAIEFILFSSHISSSTYVALRQLLNSAATLQSTAAVGQICLVSRLTMLRQIYSDLNLFKRHTKLVTALLARLSAVLHTLACRILDGGFVQSLMPLFQPPTPIARVDIESWKSAHDIVIASQAPLLSSAILSLMIATTVVLIKYPIGN